MSIYEGTRIRDIPLAHAEALLEHAERGHSIPAICMGCTVDDDSVCLRKRGVVLCDECAGNNVRIGVVRP